MAGSELLAPTQEENERLARAFERSNVEGFVEAAEGERLLRRTGLQEQQLSGIWDLSDLDRDRRLSLREFVCAMTLAEQVRKGQALPVEVQPEQQETMALGVERLLRKPGETGSRQELGAELLRGEHAAPRAAETPLGQLAQVLKLVARSDPGQLSSLAQEVLAERGRLEDELQRRRSLEEQLREARGRLDEAAAQRRKSAVEAQAAQRRIAQMQDELVFVTREVSNAEEDLQLLRQACGQEKERKAPAPYTDPDEERRDVLSKVRAERELLMKDQKAIQELRGQLEEIFKLKHEAQSKQQVLLERQRQCEQDRGFMVTAIEAERGKLLSARDDRLRLWKERSNLERLLQDVDQERLLVSRQVPGRNVPEAHRKVEQPRRKGVPHDTLLPTKGVRATPT